MYYNVVVSYRCILVSTYNLTCERPFTLNIYIRFVFFNCSKKDLVCCHFFYWLVISRIPFSCVPFHLLDRYLTIWTDNNFFPTYLVQPTSPMTPQRSPLRPSNQDTTKRRQVRLSPFSYPWQPYSSCVRLWHIYSSLWQTWRNHWVCRSIKSSDTPHRSYKQSKQNASAIVKPYPSRAQMDLRIPIKNNQWRETDFLNALPPVSGRAVDDDECAKQ